MAVLMLGLFESVSIADSVTTFWIMTSVALASGTYRCVVMESNTIALLGNTVPNLGRCYSCMCKHGMYDPPAQFRIHARYYQGSLPPE